MISNAHKIRLKALLKNDYTNDVLQLLKERKVKNSHGNYFSSAHVRNVLFGSTEHFETERAIIDVYKKRLKESAALEEEKNLLLK